MAFDVILAERIRKSLARKKNIEEKKMFGGIGFLLNGNMLVGAWKDSLIVRLGDEQGEEALLEPHVKPLETGQLHQVDRPPRHQATKPENLNRKSPPLQCAGPGRRELQGPCT